MTNKTEQIWMFKDSSRVYWYVRAVYAGSFDMKESDVDGNHDSIITNRYWDYQIFKENLQNRVWDDRLVEYDAPNILMPLLHHFLHDWVSKISNVAITMATRSTVAEEIPDVDLDIKELP
jgi:hypothetical protein